MTLHWRLGLCLGTLLAYHGAIGDTPGVDDIPDVKEGLWESNTQMPGTNGKAIHSTMCTSNLVNRKLYEQTHKNPNRPCKVLHYERSGAVLTSETECTFGGKPTRTKSVTTLSGNTAYRLETRKPDGTIETVIESKWVSACPAGMKLGDVTGPDGKVMMNMLTP